MHGVWDLYLSVLLLASTWTVAHFIEPKKGFASYSDILNPRQTPAMQIDLH